MSSAEPSRDADRRVRRVRLSQVALVAVGVFGGVVPVLAQQGTFGLGLFLAYVFAIVGIPIGYIVFTATVGSAVRAFVPEGDPPRANLVLAFLVGFPLFGAVLEVILLYRLAKATAAIEGARDRSALVVILAILRGGGVWFGAVFVGPLVLLGGEASVIAAFAAGPIVSFAILGVITQIIIAPLLDQLIPAASAVRLGGAAATSSMAVPSSSGAPANGERP